MSRLILELRNYNTELELHDSNSELRLRNYIIIYNKQYYATLFILVKKIINNIDIYNIIRYCLQVYQDIYYKSYLNKYIFYNWFNSVHY